jgi:hypothetical protein
MSLETTFNGRTYNADDYDVSTNPTGLGRGGARILWNQLWADILADIGCQMQMASVDTIELGAGPFTINPLVMRGVPVGQEAWVIADNAHKMFGAISAKTTGSFTFSPSKIIGSGSFSAWTIQPSGAQGIPGADYSANALLARLSTLTPAAATFPYFSTASAHLGTITNTALALLDDATALDMLKTLGLVVGTLFTPGRDSDFADSEAKRIKLRDVGYTASALGNRNSATTCDLEVANTFTATATGNVTWTFSNPPATGIFGEFMLHLTNGGAYTQTWPATVKWPNGVAPTLQSSGIDGLRFYTLDAGSTWHGAAVQPASA